MRRAFADIPSDLAAYEQARVVLVPVPFEGTVTYLPGTSRGPAAILDASRALELYEQDLGRRPCDVGIHIADEVVAHSPEELVARVEEQVGAILSDGKFPLVVGGEHTVAVGAFRALQRLHPDLSYLHVDAHADLRDSFEGDPLSHASVAARFRDTATGVHVGVRSLSSEEATRIREDHIPCVWATKTREPGWRAVALERLTGPVYLSLDLDVLDPSVLPAVGCPEPGGLDWWDVDALLRELPLRHRVVGMDVSELAPLPGMAWCDFVAARLVYRSIGHLVPSDPSTPVRAGK
jgi:agmatinase